MNPEESQPPQVLDYASPATPAPEQQASTMDMVFTPIVDTTVEVVSYVPGLVVEGIGALIDGL